MSMEHKKKKKIKVGTASKFVIPPAGMLSAVSARIYDMGEDSPAPQQDTPLLFTATQVEEREYVETTRRAVRNAAVIVTTSLFLVLTMTLTLFFGVRSIRSSHDSIPTSIFVHDAARKLAPIIMPERQITILPNMNPGVCYTPACRNVSESILPSLSPNYKNVNACTNFEEVVCGGWNQNRILKPDEPIEIASVFAEFEKKALTTQIEMLEGSYPINHFMSQSAAVDRENFEKIKRAYHACMNGHVASEDGIKPLMNILNEIVRLFPTETSTLSKNTSTDALEQEEMVNIIAFLSDLYIPTFVDLEPERDIKGSGKLIVRVRAPALELAREDYQDSEAVQRKEYEITEILERIYPILNVKPEYSSILAHGIVEFEKGLAVAQPDPYNFPKIWNPIPIGHASNLIRKIPLLQIICALAPPGYEVKYLNIECPDYLVALEETLSNTPREILQAYFVYRTISALYIKAGFDHTRFNASRRIWGMTDKSKICIAQVRTGLGLFLDRFYVQRAFSAVAKVMGDQMVANIKDEFVQRLRTIRWMESSVANKAIEKINMIRPNFGYPSSLDDPATLWDRSHTINISTNPLENFIVSVQSAARNAWATLGKVADGGEWLKRPTVRHGYYHSSSDEIVLPAPVMQSTSFHADVPAYISYGAFGSVLGYELYNALDLNDGLYDEGGMYYEWWTNTTIHEFQRQANSSADQNGNLTIISGAGGLDAAFAAWSHHREKHPDRGLPGLDFFTQEQLFFISFGHTYCVKQSGAYIRRLASDVVDVQTLGARIMTAVVHSRAFRESFSCER